MEPHPVKTRLIEAYDRHQPPRFFVLYSQKTLLERVQHGFTIESYRLVHPRGNIPFHSLVLRKSG